MLVAARIAGLVAVVAMGLAIGLLYDVPVAGAAAKFWLPISAALAFAVVFLGAPLSKRALSRYETTPPGLSGVRIFMGVASAAIAVAVSNLLLLVGIFVR